MLAIAALLLSISASVQQPEPQAPRVLHVDVVLPDGKPARGASVSWVDSPRASEEWRKLAKPSEPWDWFDFHERFGVKFTADAGGSVEIPNVASNGSLEATLGSLYGTLPVENPGAEPLRLVLAEDHSVTIQVISLSSAPAAGAFVEIRYDVEQPMRTLWWGATGADGTATLRHAQTLLTPRDDTQMIATFAFPSIDAPSIAVDPVYWPKLPLSLFLPATGSVIVELPPSASSIARLRLAPKDTSSEFSFNREPVFLPAAGGRAVFPHVGLELRLQLSAAWEDASAPETVVIDGPRTLGDEVVHSFVAAASSAPRIHARVLDHADRPLARTKLQITISLDSGSRSSSRGVFSTTDDEGCFELAITQPWAPGDTRTVMIRTQRVSESAMTLVDQPKAEFDMSRELSPGTLELGDLRLKSGVADASTKDEELEALYAKFTKQKSAWDRQRKIECVLTEMIRRGGSRWKKFVEAQLASLRPAGATEESAFEIQDLELLTSLRRLQKKPDPLRVTIAGSDSVFETVFPELPVFHATLTNVDVEKRSFGFSDGGDDRRGLLARWRIESTSSPRSSLEAVAMPAGFAFEIYSRKFLQPGEPWECDLPMRRYVFPRSGREWQVRVLYHDQISIADDSSVDGLICATSEPFTVRWKPRQLKSTAKERASIERALAAIDTTKAIPLMPAFAIGGRGAIGTATSPQQKIFAAGIEAMPVLLEALERKDLDAARRAWVLALLYDITGMNDPRFENGSLGKYQILIEDSQSSTGGAVTLEGSVGTNDGGPIASKQEPLVLRWLDLKPMLQVTR